MGTHRLSVGDASGLLSARLDGRVEAGRLGACQTGATLAATVVSELARNVIQHGGGGELTITASGDCLVIETRDLGPGIANIRLALTHGYSTDGSAGVGLSGVARVAMELSIVNGDPTGVQVRVVLPAARLRWGKRPQVLWAAHAC